MSVTAATQLGGGSAEPLGPEAEAGLGATRLGHVLLAALSCSPGIP